MVETEHEAHGGRFTGAVRTEETGDTTCFDGERQIGHGGFAAVAFGEVGGGYHGVYCRWEGLNTQTSIR